jgi:hypothetical protein
LEPGAHPVARVGNEVVGRRFGDRLSESHQGAQVGRFGAKEREHQDLGPEALEKDGLLVAAPVGRDSHSEAV